MWATLSLALVLALGGSGDPDLAAAEDAWQQGEYEAVLPRVQAALAQDALSVAERRRAWELAALAHSAFDRQARAVDAFRHVLGVDGSYVPDRRSSPKVQAYFRRAQSLGPLEDPALTARAAAQPGPGSPPVEGWKAAPGASAPAWAPSPEVPSPAPGQRASASNAVLRQWWFWGAVGVAAAVAGGTAWAVTRPQVPEGSLGTGALRR